MLAMFLFSRFFSLVHNCRLFVLVVEFVEECNPAFASWVRTHLRNFLLMRMHVEQHKFRTHQDNIVCILSRIYLNIVNKQNCSWNDVLILCPVYLKWMVSYTFNALFSVYIMNANFNLLWKWSCQCLLVWKSASLICRITCAVFTRKNTMLVLSHCLSLTVSFLCYGCRV